MLPGSTDGEPSPITGFYTPRRPHPDREIDPRSPGAPARPIIILDYRRAPLTEEELKIEALLQNVHDLNDQAAIRHAALGGEPLPTIFFSQEETPVTEHHPPVIFSICVVAIGIALAANLPGIMKYFWGEE